MSTNLNSDETSSTLYATLCGVGNGQLGIQVTLVGTVHTVGPGLGENGAPFSGAAYLNLPVDEFRAWLREVSESLDRETGSDVPPAFYD